MPRNIYHRTTLDKDSLMFGNRMDFYSGIVLNVHVQALSSRPISCRRIIHKIQNVIYHYKHTIVDSLDPTQLGLSNDMAAQAC